MKVKVTDFKHRKGLHKELEHNLIKVLKFLGIENELKQVNIKVLKKYPSAQGYDQAFFKLYQKGIVNLIITPSYDQNKYTRMSLIAHELTHVKQFINKELIFSLKAGKKVYFYHNKKYTKVYSFDKFDQLSHQRKKQIEYISKICPWEKEPCMNADVFESKASYVV